MINSHLPSEPPPGQPDPIPFPPDHEFVMVILRTEGWHTRNIKVRR